MEGAGREKEGEGGCGLIGERIQELWIKIPKWNALNVLAQKDFSTCSLNEAFSMPHMADAD